MRHSSTAAAILAKRTVLSLAASAILLVGSPVVATSSAAPAGGTGKPVSAGFGDCKNNNGGLHQGYVCPSTTTGSGGGVILS